MSRQTEMPWWSWAANPDKQFLIAEKLGFYHECSEEANRPKNYEHLKHFTGADWTQSLPAYYGAFEKCFNREMQQRFEHVNPTAGGHSISHFS